MKRILARCNSASSIKRENGTMVGRSDMSIKRSLFPPTILVVPNSEYFFGQLRSTEDLLKIVRKFDCAGVATVLVTGIGAFGFAFPVQVLSLL